MSWPPRKPKIPEGYDPDFPYFIEQRELILERAKQAQREQQRERMQRRLVLLRPTRRAAAMAAVLSLIGATAGAVVITRQGPPGTGVANTKPTPIATGTTNDEHWTLLAWYDANDLCVELLAGGTEQSGCNVVPAGASVQALTLRTPVNAYSFGLTGQAASDVAVELQGAHVHTPVHADDGAEGAPVLPEGVQWFVVGVPRTQ